MQEHRAVLHTPLFSLTVASSKCSKLHVELVAGYQNQMLDTEGTASLHSRSSEDPGVTTFVHLQHATVQLGNLLFGSEHGQMP